MACVRARGECVCVRLSAPCVRTRPPRRTLIGFDGFGKVTSLPDCVDFPPERSNPTGRSETLLHAAVERKPKICALLSLCHDNSVTAEYNWHGGVPGALFMHFSCFNLELPQRDSFLFSFFFFRGHILKSENIWETRNKEGQRSPSRRYANLNMITEDDHRER